MTDTTAGFGFLADDTRPAPPPKADWPLMGDILSARCDIPEHLIRWNRAKGYDDPPPKR